MVYLNTYIYTSSHLWFI